MREIKFRAWDGSRMEYDVVVGRHSKDAPGSPNTVVIIDDGDCWFPEEPYPVLMQYTCMKDKKGKEVYEGDIMAIGAGLRCIVGWNQETSAFCAIPSVGGEMSDHLCGADICEVIGNVYENPELVEEKDERR